MASDFLKNNNYNAIFFLVEMFLKSHISKIRYQLHSEDVFFHLHGMLSIIFFPGVPGK